MEMESAREAEGYADEGEDCQAVIIEFAMNTNVQR